MLELNDEIRRAVRESPSGVEVVDPETQKHYVVIDRDTHARVIRALEDVETRVAIARGIAEMDDHRGMTVDDSERLICERFGFPNPEQ